MPPPGQPGAPPAPFSAGPRPPSGGGMMAPPQGPGSARPAMPPAPGMAPPGMPGMAPPGMPGMAPPGMPGMTGMRPPMPGGASVSAGGAPQMPGPPSGMQPPAPPFAPGEQHTSTVCSRRWHVIGTCVVGMRVANAGSAGVAGPGGSTWMPCPWQTIPRCSAYSQASSRIDAPGPSCCMCMMTRSRRELWVVSACRYARPSRSSSRHDAATTRQHGPARHGARHAPAPHGPADAWRPILRWLWCTVRRAGGQLPAQHLLKAPRFLRI